MNIKNNKYVEIDNPLIEETLPPEMRVKINEVGGLDFYARLLLTSKRNFDTLKSILPRKGNPVHEAWVQRQCEQMSSEPRRAYAFYKKNGSEPLILKGLQLEVIKDIPLKEIIATTLITAAIKLAFLSMHGQLTGIVESLISSLPTVINISMTYIGTIAALNYFKLCKDEKWLHLVLGAIAVVAINYLAKVPDIITQLFKNSGYTTFYFLVLHAITVGSLIMFNKCRNPSTLFKTFGLLIITFSFFRNLANNF